MASIYLVRHGQASFGTDNYDCLSALGQRQAQWIGRYLVDTGLAIDAVYAGALLRQQQTAEGVIAELKKHEMSLPDIVTDARLDEMDNAGQVQLFAPLIAERDAAVAELLQHASSSSKHYQKLLEKVFHYWQALPDPQQEQESWPAFQQRAQAAMRMLMTQQGAGKNSLVITSGGVIATLTAWVLGLPDSTVYRFYEPLVNASITRVLYNSDKMSLSFFNDHSFLALLGAQAGVADAVTYR